METLMRIGFVGCGGIAERHMQALGQVPGVAMMGFCDINRERAEQMARQYGAEGAQVFEEAKALFEAMELDAVWFCLPPFAHGAELLAVERGIPFFVEKPVNLFLEQAKEIQAAVEEKGLLTSVGYMNRYRRGVQAVRRLLQDDPPILLLGGWIGSTPKGGGIWSWWIQKDKSGGQFHEQVTHTVDLVRFLAGEVVEVYARAARGFNRDVPEAYSIEDAAAVTLRLASGAVANLWASCSANAGGGGVSLSVYANHLTALFTGWDHRCRLMRTGEDIIEFRSEGDIFRIEDEAFIQALRQKEPERVLCSYADGVRTLQVTLAANRSMETGQPVEVTL